MTHRQFLELFVALGLQTSVVVVIAAAISKRNQSPRGRDLLWSVCLAAIALLPFADLLLPHLRLIRGRMPEPGEPIASGQAAAILFQTIFWVWLTGAVVGLFHLVRDVRRLFPLFRAASPAPAPFIDRLREDLKALRDGGNALCVGRREVTILLSESIRSPSCWQLHRPMVVLPAAVASFAPDEIALIVRHELGHLRSGHPVLLFVQRIVEIVFWWHPLVRWAARQAERAREFRCDQIAVETRQAAACYLRTILRLSLVNQKAALGSAISLGFGAECALIVERAERLASQDWNMAVASETSWRAAAPAVAAALAMLTLWAPLGVTASRRSLWSPWPGWSARMLQSLGVPARDYEVDGHRLSPHEYERSRNRSSAD